MVISPFLSIVEDQVNYLRSLRIEAAFIGESKAIKIKKYCMYYIVWKLGVIHWGLKIQGNVLKSFIKRILLLLLVMRCILPFIGKDINLFT